MQPYEAATPASADPHDTRDQAVWEEFAALLDETQQQASVLATDDDRVFYHDLVARCVDAVAAISGAAWRRSGAGSRRRIAQVGVSADHNEATAEREELLTLADRSISVERRRLVANEAVGIAMTVQPLGSSRASAGVLLELLLPAERSDAYYDAAARLLGAVANAAAVYETRRHTTSLETALQRHAESRRLTESVAGDLGLTPTAMRIASEAVTAVGADRVAVVVSGRVAAVSGVHRVDQRGPAAGAWRRLVYGMPNQPLCWPIEEERHDEAPDETLKTEIDRCIDATHARALHVAPIRSQRDSDDALLGWLIAEWFDGSRPAPDRLTLVDAADAVSASLEAATSASRRGVFGLLGRLRNMGVALLATAVLIGGLIAAAALTPVQHTVTAKGVLTPTEQRGVFAPSDATVANLHVVAGERVAAGQLLAELSDLRSLIEIEELSGRIRTLEEQHAAAVALRLTGDRDEAPADRLRLAAEQQRLAAQLAGLQAERDLLLAERNRLRVTSPIDGVVTTWQAETLLAGKPVGRGELLLTVADDQGDWSLELEAPEDRFDLVQKAAESADKPLRIVYETQGPSSGAYEAELEKIAPSASVVTDPFGVERRYMPLVATPALPDQPLGEATPLPGASVRAKIYCGERSFAYVALHDAWRTLTTWWRL